MARQMYLAIIVCLKTNAFVVSGGGLDTFKCSQSETTLTVTAPVQPVQSSPPLEVPPRMEDGFCGTAHVSPIPGTVHAFSHSKYFTLRVHSSGVPFQPISCHSTTMQI